METKEILRLDSGGPRYNRAKVLKTMGNAVKEYERLYKRDTKRIDGYSLKIAELIELLDMDLYTAIYDAYTIGFTRGSRYQKSKA